LESKNSLKVECFLEIKNYLFTDVYKTLTLIAASGCVFGEMEIRRGFISVCFLGFTFLYKLKALGK
jgi:hypothetical protein